MSLVNSNWRFGARAWLYFFGGVWATGFLCCQDVPTRKVECTRLFSTCTKKLGDVELTVWLLIEDDRVYGNIDEPGTLQDDIDAAQDVM